MQLQYGRRQQAGADSNDDGKVLTATDGNCSSISDDGSSCRICKSNPDGGGIGGQRPHPEQVAEVVEVAAAVPPAAASGSIK